MFNGVHSPVFDEDAATSPSPRFKQEPSYQLQPPAAEEEQDMYRYTQDGPLFISNVDPYYKMPQYPASATAMAPHAGPALLLEEPLFGATFHEQPDQSFPMQAMAYDQGYGYANPQAAPQFAAPANFMRGSSAGPSTAQIKVESAAAAAVAAAAKKPPQQWAQNNIDDANGDECGSLKDKSPVEKLRVKSAHNVIEQRYRNKINDKFAALQNSVPTLRVLAKRQGKSKFDEDDEDNDYEGATYSADVLDNLEGLEPATKLNKGTILSKSVEYIKFLESKNDKMTMELRQLVARAQMLGFVLDDDLTPRGLGPDNQ